MQTLWTNARSIADNIHMSQNPSDNPTPAAASKSLDRRVKIGFLAAVIAIAFFVYLKQSKDPQIEGWATSMPTFPLDAQARKDKTQVIVFFHGSPMSHDDKRMIASTINNPDGRTKAAMEKAAKNGQTFVKVSLGKEGNDELFEKYKITATPTMLLFDADGKEIKRLDRLVNDISFYQDFLGLKGN